MPTRADEIEALIADIRSRLGKRPRLIHVFELLLEHLEHVDLSASEQEEAVQWLHYAVKSPKMAELIYSLARLVQAEIGAGRPVAPLGNN